MATTNNNETTSITTLDLGTITGDDKKDTITRAKGWKGQIGEQITALTIHTKTLDASVQRLHKLAQMLLEHKLNNEKKCAYVLEKCTEIAKLVDENIGKLLPVLQQQEKDIAKNTLAIDGLLAREQTTYDEFQLCNHKRDEELAKIKSDTQIILGKDEVVSNYLE